MRKIPFCLMIDPEIRSVFELFAKIDENSVSGVIRKVCKDYIIERWKRSTDTEKEQIKKAKNIE